MRPGQYLAKEYRQIYFHEQLTSTEKVGSKSNFGRSAGGRAILHPTVDPPPV